MADSGWFKTFREMFSMPEWLNSTPGQKAVLMVILKSANQQAKSWEWNGKQYTVQPGQLITSPQKLADQCGRGVSRQMVRGALARFTKLGVLTTKTTKESTLITVERWAVESSEGKTQPTTQPTDNQPTTTTKNHKNHKSNTNRHSDGQKTDQLRNDFEVLWSLYPRKQGKQTAIKAYQKAIKEGVTNEEIKNGIVAYKKYLIRNDKEPQFIKQGSSFFNQRAWQDDWSDGLSPEQPVSKTPSKAAEAYKDIISLMNDYSSLSREKAAKLVADIYIGYGETTSAEKILTFLRQYEKDPDSAERPY